MAERSRRSSGEAYIDKDKNRGRIGDKRGAVGRYSTPIVISRNSVSLKKRVIKKSMNRYDKEGIAENCTEEAKTFS
jgi:hypothetical protein